MFSTNLLPLLNVPLVCKDLILFFPMLQFFMLNFSVVQLGLIKKTLLYPALKLIYFPLKIPDQFD